MLCRILRGVAAPWPSSRRLWARGVAIALALVGGPLWSSGQPVGFEVDEGFALGPITLDSPGLDYAGTAQTAVVDAGLPQGQALELFGGGALSIDVLTAGGADRLSRLLLWSPSAGHERVTVGTIALDWRHRAGAWVALEIGRREASGIPVSLDGAVVGYLGTLAGVSVGLHPVDGRLRVDDLHWTAVESGEPAPSRGLLREVWLGIKGSQLRHLKSHPTYPGTPSVVDVVPEFEAPTNWANHYGTRLRGYLRIPETGTYQFWIAGDDQSELYLSTDDDPTNLEKIAYVPGWTSSRVWDKYPEQASEPLQLEAGQRLFVEAFQKEGGGGDNLAVAWSREGFAAQTVIDGQYLEPYDLAGVYDGRPSFAINAGPDVSLYLPNREITLNGVAYNLGAFDSAPDILWSPAGSPGASVSIADQTATVAQVPGAGEYFFDLSASQGSWAFFDYLKVTAREPLAADVGGITYEAWLGLSNPQLDAFERDPKSQGEPDLRRELSAFDGPEQWSDRFGARIRGFVLAPVAGDYHFWVSGNDSASLWVSGNGEPSDIERVAFTEGATKRHQMTKYASQSAAPLTLTAGQRIYVEARQVEKWGPDHLSVFWQTPEMVRPQLVTAEFMAPFTPAPDLEPEVNLVALAGSDRRLHQPRSELPLHGGFKRLRPSDEAPTFQWSLLSGPGLVEFGDPSNPESSAHFSGAGSYVLQLEVFDSVDRVTDTVKVEVVPPLDPEVGGVTREVWLQIPHTRLDRLQDHPRFLSDRPDIKDVMPAFEAPSNWAEEYGTRMRAYLMVPETGWYRFWVAGDDQSQLWLNDQGEDDSGARRIAQVKWWSGYRGFDQRSEQRSEEFFLETGRRYYIEGLQKEGGGEDHLTVAWQGAGIPQREIIEGAYLIPFESAPTHAGALELVVGMVDPLYWPQDEVTINATVFDLDPGPTEVTGSWRQVEGPAGGAIEPLEGFDVRARFPGVGAYVLRFSASDGVHERSVDVPVTIRPALSSSVGGITREVWFGIRGNDLDALIDASDFPDQPFVRDIAPKVATPVNWSDSYGVRLRGYLIPPEGGEYTFWLAGDDHSELWLSPDASSDGARKRAHVHGWTHVQQWDRYGSQQSEPIVLEAGQRYYLEVLSKEGWGGDHVEVAWQGPGVGERQIIDGAFVEPFVEAEAMDAAQALFVDAGDPQTIFWPGDQVSLRGATHYARAEMGRSLSLRWSKITGDGSVVFADPHALETAVRFSAPGVYVLGLEGADGVDTSVDTVVISVEPALAPDTGSVLREVWLALGGRMVSALTDSERYPEAPTVRDNLRGFEAPANWANHYGSRFRGFLHVPVSGDYEFFLSSDDYSDLWLSSDETDSNARSIAVVNSWNRPRDWFRKAHQRSGMIHLEANRKYYIEARHKESGGNDHFAVGWRMPGESEVKVIDRGFLAPYEVAPESDGALQLLTHGPGTLVWPESEARLLGVAYDLQRGPEPLTFRWESLDAGASLVDPLSRAPVATFSGPGTYRFRFHASDGIHSAFHDVEVTVASGADSDAYGLLREVWFGVRGNDLSRLLNDERYPESPDLTETLLAPETPRDWADNYGTRLRGFLHPPDSGTYYLWIAGDDETRLILGEDASADTAREVAWIDGWSSYRQWNRNVTTQRSSALELQAGQEYYLEVLHKEGWGGDHVSIGWSRGPDEEPTLIPRGYLTPLFAAPALDSEIQVSAGPDLERMAPETRVELSGWVRDLDAGPYQLEAGWSGPADVILSRDNAAETSAIFPGPGVYVMTLSANDGVHQRSDSMTVTIQPPLDPEAGFVVRETYQGISGGTIDALRSSSKFPGQPDARDVLTSLEGPVNWLNNYGTRIRGYLHPPTSGTYQFWIAGDDQSEFWLGGNEQPDSVGPKPAARVPRWSSSRQWEKYPEQASTPRRLEAGQSLYFEILHKEGGGGDNIAVAWQGPGMPTREVISGAYLSPYSASGDETPPAIVLSGPLVVELELGQEFVEPGFVATDNEDGDLTDDVVIAGDVDPQAPGNYTLAYSVRDYSGNASATAIRTVKVTRGVGRGSSPTWPPTTPPEFLPPAPPTWTPPAAIGARDAARFLTQATFGPDSASIAALRTQGFDGWFQEQMGLEPSWHLPHLQEALNLLGDGLYYGSTDMQTVMPKEPRTDDRMYTWWTHAIEAPDQLRQRMAFALSEILVVSDRSPALRRYPEGMAHYYDILVRHALGNYRDLIQEVSLSPIMGIYLTSLRNTKPDYESGILPDENYARELLQLFSIGLEWLYPDGSPRLDASGQRIPTFGMDEILAFARVFTGWTFSGSTDFFWTRYRTEDVIQPMMAFEEWHDTEPKTLLGGVTLPANQTAYADLSNALDNIFYHPNVGPFIAHALIQRLVTSNPSPGYIYRVASAFDDNGHGVRGDLAAVAKAILMDEEARNPVHTQDPRFGKLKEPILRMTGLIRAFYAFQTDSPPTLGRFGLSTDVLGPLGQAPLYAPSVFNFFDKDYRPMGPIADAGLVAPEFQITSEASVVTGANYFHQGIDRGFATDSGFLERITLNLAELLDQGVNVDGALDLLDLVLMSGQMSPETRGVLRDTLLDIGPDTIYRAESALQLLITAPEYVIQR